MTRRRRHCHMRTPVPRCTPPTPSAAPACSGVRQQLGCGRGGRERAVCTPGAAAAMASPSLTLSIALRAPIKPQFIAAALGPPLHPIARPVAQPEAAWFIPTGHAQASASVQAHVSTTAWSTIHAWGKRTVLLLPQPLRDAEYSRVRVAVQCKALQRSPGLSQLHSALSCCGRFCV